MSSYQAWVFLHVASVIVWMGAGTTLALISLHAQRARDSVLLERLGALTGFLGRRVFGPSALAALVFGIVAAHSAHWGSPLWIVLGYGAFVVSFLLNVGVRLPLLRRVSNGVTPVASTGRPLCTLALVELSVMYLAVADMVVKPTRSDTGAIAGGGGLFALAVIAAAITAARNRPGLSS